jgi:hypothetical protein
MKAVIGGVVGLCVSGIVAAALIPNAVDTIVLANTDLWTGKYATLATTWPLLALFIVLGAVIIVVMYVISFA